MKVALGWLWRGGVLGIIAFVIFGPLANLVLWAVAIQWYFPHKLPLTYGFRYWGEVFKPTSDAFARHQRPDRRNHRARLPAARHSGRLCARPPIFAGARLDSADHSVASGIPECCRLSQHRPAVLYGRAQRHDRRGGARTRRAWTRDRGMDRRGGFCRGRWRARARRPQHGSLGAAHHAHDNVAIGGARSDGGSNLRLSRIARRVYRHLLRRGSRRHDLAADDVYREPWRKLSDRGDYRADPAGPFDRLYAADRAVSEHRDARQSRLIKS